MKAWRSARIVAASMVFYGAVVVPWTVPGCSDDGGTTKRSFVDDKGRRCTYDCTRDSCSAYICTPDPAPATSCDQALTGSRRCYVLGYVPATDRQIGLCDACCVFDAEAGLKEAHDPNQCAAILCKVGADCPTDTSLCRDGRCVRY